jgi:hypothetical protein
MTPDTILSEEEFCLKAAERLEINPRDLDAYTVTELVTSVAMDIYLYGTEKGCLLDKNCHRLLQRMLEGKPLAFERDGFDLTLH